MTTRKDPIGAREGLRERKRRETLARVTNSGICLFIARGYDATTIDDIAAAAGISRRTFFYYFKSKDDILLSLQSGMGEQLAAIVRHAPPDTRPLDAIRDAAVTVCAAIPVDDMIAIDRLMRSSEAVQARKQASYVQHEATLFAAVARAMAGARARDRLAPPCFARRRHDAAVLGYFPPGRRQAPDPGSIARSVRGAGTGDRIVFASGVMDAGKTRCECRHSTQSRCRLFNCAELIPGIGYTMKTNICIQERRQ
jgi:AcrR family transcriptional regulator